MRHLQTESHFRLALFALQDADGYVDTLLEIAREQALSPRPAIFPAHSPVWFTSQPRSEAARKRASFH